MYAHLLSDSPATGYRVAKALGKPTPNVYKAIESLQEKGAVVVDVDKTRHCRAVPAEEFLSRLDRQFQQRRRQATHALARIRPAADDTRIYQMRSRQQVLERARTMLATAEEIVLVDAFPQPLEQIRPDIERAGQRGIDVAVKAYAPCPPFEGAEVVLETHGERVRRRWPVDWFNVVTDGAEMLLALLDRSGDGVVQAIWSSSPSLAWTLHNTFATELSHSALAAVIAREGDLAEIRRTFDHMQRFLAPEAPGYFRLLRHLGLEAFAASSLEEPDS